MKKASLEFLSKGEFGENAIIRVEIFDRELLNSEIKYRLLCKVKVHKSRAINREEVLLEKSIATTSGETVYDIEIPTSSLETYTYSGNHIDVELHSVLIVDDGILFDTKIKDKHELPLIDKPEISESAKKLVEPKDTYSFFANLKALSPQRRVLTSLAVFLGFGSALAFAVVGIHDQLAVEQDVWLFSHVSSSSKQQSPWVGGVVPAIFLIIGTWAIIHWQLKKYISVQWSPALPQLIKPGTGYPVGELFQAKSRVDLEDMTLRIVACNMECGQYRRKSGKRTRTVSFRKPVRGVVLFEKTIKRVRANTPINAWFATDDVSFDEMFRVLYPANMLGDSHGLDVYWELQFLHPEFVDRELVGESKHFRYQDFIYDLLEF